MVFTFGIFSFAFIPHVLMTLCPQWHWKSTAKNESAAEDKARLRAPDCVHKRSELYFAWGGKSLRGSSWGCAASHSGELRGRGRGEQALNYVNVDKLGRTDRIRRHLESDIF